MTNRPLCHRTAFAAPCQSRAMCWGSQAWGWLSRCFRK